MKIIAFGTLKGGTGKTTVAFNVAGILAETNKVLLIDVDPQSNLSDNVGIDTADQGGLTIREVLENPTRTYADDVIVEAPMEQMPNIDIIASHIRLTAVEMQLVGTPARERILQRWIERNSEYLSKYDYIIIDTNPSMGVINQNAFVAADHIILVSDVSRKAIQGAELFAYLWGEIADAIRMDNKIDALVLNNYDCRIGLARELFEFYKGNDDFGSIILDHVIPARVDVKNTELKYLPVNVTAPNSQACSAFRSVVKELIEREVL